MAVDHDNVPHYGMILPAVHPSVGDAHVGHAQHASAACLHLAVTVHRQPRIAVGNCEQTAACQQTVVHLAFGKGQEAHARQHSLHRPAHGGLLALMEGGQTACQRKTENYQSNKDRYHRPRQRTIIMPTHPSQQRAAEQHKHKPGEHQRIDHHTQHPHHVAPPLHTDKLAVQLRFQCLKINRFHRYFLNKSATFTLRCSCSGISISSSAQWCRLRATMHEGNISMVLL